MRATGRQSGWRHFSDTGLSLPSWGKPHVPLAPLAEVTLGLRSTPIRITTIPSSVSSICNISSNVTKVSAQKSWVPWGHVPLEHDLGAPDLGWGTMPGAGGLVLTVQSAASVCFFEWVFFLEGVGVGCL